MKISCTKCGKRFNAEQHLYICPKCNHYHSQTGVRGSTSDSSSVSKIKDKIENVNVLELIDEVIPDDTQDEGPEFIQTVNGEQTIYTARKPEKQYNSKSKKHISLFKRIWLGLCIVGGCILFIAGPTADMLDKGAWSDNSDSWDSGWSDSFNRESEVEFGEPMNFETFTVIVEGVSEPEYDGLTVEDGWKLVQVNFETEGSYGYEDEAMLTEVLLCHGSESNENQYWPLYEDEITSDKDVEKQLREDGLVTEAHYSGSYFCIFEIPEEVEDVVLRINSYVPEGDQSMGSYVEDERFKMAMLL